MRQGNSCQFSDFRHQLDHADALARSSSTASQPRRGPVEIQALARHPLAMEKDTLRMVVLNLYLPSKDLPRHVTMDADSFGTS